jgi:hypothetical protein
MSRLRMAIAKKKRPGVNRGASCFALEGDQ